MEPTLRIGSVAEPIIQRQKISDNWYSQRSMRCNNLQSDKEFIWNLVPFACNNDMSRMEEGR